MAVFLPFVPNWQNGVRDIYEFKTDIFTARDGSEQRRATRMQARRSLTASVLLDGDRLRFFADALTRAKDGKVEIVDFSAESAVLTQTVAAGGTLLRIDKKPSWLVSGITCGLLTGRRSRKVQIDFVEGTSVLLNTGVVGAVGHGATLLPLVPASVANSNTLSLQSNSLATSSLRFDIEPGYVNRVPDALPVNESASGDSVQEFGPAAILLGRYVLLRKPNFLNRPQVQFNLPFENVDYGRGIVKTFAPVPIVSRTLTATYLATSRAEALAMLDVFIRCRGRAGEIYIPTWGNDLPPVTSVSGSTIRFSGLDVFETYAGDKAHAAILIRDKSGKLYPREITAITAQAGNTLLQVHAGLPVAASQIAEISWLFVARFAQDTFTIEWTTTEVANLTLSFTTLANLAVESSFGSNWILATGFWRDRGQWVDSATWED